jgi:hypothetical protein
MADSFRAPVRAPGAASSRLRRRSARERQLLSGPLAQACEPLGSSAQVNRPKHHAGTMRRDPLGGWVLGQDVPAVLDQLRDQRPLARNGLQPDDAHSRVAAVPGSRGQHGRTRKRRSARWMALDGAAQKPRRLRILSGGLGSRRTTVDGVTGLQRPMRLSWFPGSDGSGE